MLLNNVVTFLALLIGPICFHVCGQTTPDWHHSHVYTWYKPTTSSQLDQLSIKTGNNRKKLPVPAASVYNMLKKCMIKCLWYTYAAT